jgi:GntR family transcriptional regulator/MocR family aminotransferase
VRQIDIQGWMALDRSSAEPLYRQVYRTLQQLILAGRLLPGAKLPSIRDFAASLEISRNTIVNALDQLGAEGYLEARVGAGTFVSRTLPESQLQVSSRARPAPVPRPHSGKLSSRGRAVAALLDPAPDRPGFVSPVGAFSIDGPDLEHFPWETWQRLSGRLGRRVPRRLLGYQQDLGFGPLREALAEHLAGTRGVRCSADQILIVSGSQEALFLAGNVLLDPGDEAWIEDPGYPGVRRALTAAGARLMPVKVDDEGMDVAWGEAHCPRARLVSVTPAHQFPLGPTMSLRRRLALLAWADATSGWILEDDYDSEYRYQGRPLQALQGLDGGQRVLYVGTFSKVLFPGLRLGYMVAPPQLIRALAAARTAVDLHPPTLPQAILAEFMVRGHYWQHVRRMRKVYAARCQELVETLKAEFGPELKLGPYDSGMHVVLWLPPGTGDRDVSQRAAELEVECLPVSAFVHGGVQRSGLLLGFGRLAIEDIRPAVTRLAQAVRDVIPPS